MCAVRARIDEQLPARRVPASLPNAAPVSHRIGTSVTGWRVDLAICSVWSGPIGYRYISSFGSSGGSIAANASGVGMDRVSDRRTACRRRTSSSL